MIKHTFSINIRRFSNVSNSSLSFFTSTMNTSNGLFFPCFFCVKKFKLSLFLFVYLFNPPAKSFPFFYNSSLLNFSIKNKPLNPTKNNLRTKQQTLGRMPQPFTSFVHLHLPPPLTFLLLLPPLHLHLLLPSSQGLLLHFHLRRNLFHRPRFSRICCFSFFSLP